MSLARGGDGRAPAGRVELTRRALRACRECGSPFAASGTEESCGTCAKDRNLMQTVFALVERRRAASGDGELNAIGAGGDGPPTQRYGG
jgi:hypothetical protein